jgi:RimJ/RimL family protein N-acetyltransferase
MCVASGTFADKPTIEGERVILRPMTAEDAQALYASLDDEEARRLTGTHGTFSYDEILAWAASRPHTTDRLDLSIIDRVTGEWVGELAILDWDEANHSCGFRIALVEGGRNRGFGSEATRLIIDYVFQHLPINRIGHEVNDFNARAMRVYERAGFTREGVHRAALYWDGQYHDALLMSILRDEWLARRRGDSI